MIRQANILLVVFCSFLLAYWLRFDASPLPQPYWIALLVGLALAAIVLPGTGAFRADLEWFVLRRLRRLIAGWVIVLLLLISIAAALKITDYYSRIWFGLWSLISILGVATVTLIAHAAAVRTRTHDRQSNLVVLVGSGEAAVRLERHISQDPSSNMTVAARFGKAWSEFPTSPVSDLSGYLENHKVAAVWIAVPWDDKHTLRDSLEELRESIVDVHVVPDLEQYRLLNQQVSEWSGLPVISLAGVPMTSAEKGLKLVFDWSVALFLVFVLSPLLLVLAILVRVTSPGPVLFRQLRHGIGGDPIGILKFRTMKIHRESSGQITQASKTDERITAVGRFLRRSSLDELPQLFNVLKGDMSLVGPRPHAIEHNELYKSRIPRYMLRHKVKPGITGWAQVNGYRGQTDTIEKMSLRIEHDLWYLQHWSLWLDLKILLMTPFVLFHKNAY